MNDYPRPTIGHWICVRVLRFYMFITFFEIIDRENLITEGPGIPYMNHPTRWEPLFAAVLYNRIVHYVTGKEYFVRPPKIRSFKDLKQRVMRWVIVVSQSVEMDRDQPKMSQVKQCIRVLKGGALLGACPEGTRNGFRGPSLFKRIVAFFGRLLGIPTQPFPVERLLPFHVGGANFARRTQSPVQPIHVKWKGPRARIVIGKAFVPAADSDDDETTAWLREEIIRLGTL